MPRSPSRQSPTRATLATADRLHSAAIRLLRRLRRRDAETGLSAPRLSALSVVVFRGPITLSELAAAEQVRPPTMTRLVQELERAGLLERLADPTDRRVVRVRATAAGRRLLAAGRMRRVQRLAEEIERLSAEERRALTRGVDALWKMTSRGIDESGRGSSID
jgi:DNA-binding MarR family transcriptional regulator